MRDVEQAQTFEINPGALSAGNTVTVGLTLMRLHFNDYFVRSLLAHLWLSLAVVVGALIVGLGTGLGFSLGAFTQASSLWIVGILLGGLLASIGLFYISARFVATGAVMTRMGVNTLRRRYEVNELHRQTVFRRIWRYGIAAVAYGLLTLLVYGVLLFLGAVVVVQAQVPWRNLQAQITDPRLQAGLFISALILGLIYVAIVGLVGYYLTARLWFFDAVLAMEPQRSSLSSLRRSWELTRGRGWSITTVMFTTTLITFPISGLAAVIGIVIPFISFFAGIFVFPLWQAIKAANYFDLAATRTGLRFDLESPAFDPRHFLRRFAIQTPEGVALDFALGGSGSRVLAWMIDQIILYFVLAVLLWAGAITYAYVLLPILVERFESVSVDDLNLWALAISSLVGFIISNGYFIYCETFRRGQTPGKQFAHIRVVRDDGQPIGIREATLRSFVGWIDLGFFVIGLALILLNRTEKRLGDMAAGTLVIQDEKASRQQALVLPKQFSRLTEDTAAVLDANVDSVGLSINQYLILRSFLGCRDQLSAADRAQTTQKLGAQLRRILMPASPATLGTLPDENLIEAVYLRNLPTYQAL